LTLHSIGYYISHPQNKIITPFLYKNNKLDHKLENRAMEKWIITPRQRCDLEMLLVGGFAPLTGFLSEADYTNVLINTRLANGQLWPMPITLDVNDAFAQKIVVGDTIGLYDTDNILLAYMNITDKWQPDKLLEAHHIFGTDDLKHPAVDYLFHKAGTWYLGGAVTVAQIPAHYDFVELRHTPSSLKEHFAQLGWQTIVGFQTRNPLHRAHMELTLKAAKQVDGNILIHPVVGLTKPGDIDYFTRVRCYQKLLHYYPEEKATLSLLPLAMRMAGPKEALWHTLIRKNYGCTHFIIGRDHAGPGYNSEGKLFYDPYAAQTYVTNYQDEIDIKVMPFQEMVYVKERQRYCTHNEIKPEETALTISGTWLRNALLTEQSIPDWFSFPEIIQELRESYPAKHKKGFTLFFTGLSGAGKSTLAQALMAALMSAGKRNITMLDGDVVRRVLASELGFSKADRDLNIKRIGYVAAEVTKAGGVTLCAAIAPYTSARDYNRELISQYGDYIEVYVATPLSICEERDTKGLYAKARNGDIKGLTGVDDPYEPPVNPEIIINTNESTIEHSVKTIIDYLFKEGYLQSTIHQHIKYSQKYA
jgi:sulfate adenylyltransferase